MNAAQNSFADYVMDLDGDQCFMAGLPGYPRNFSRDTLLAGILAGNGELLASQLEISYKYQGDHDDQLSGEEPGKIHHEYPGYPLTPPYLSTYNACDTTALYLIALELLGSIDGPVQDAFVAAKRTSIEEATAYIQRHLRDNIFWEYPPAGAEHYSLRTTYWKDSIVPDATHGEEPKYPVSFALAHFQNARGILAASALLRREDLANVAVQMYKTGIQTFIRPEAFCVEQDAVGRIEQPSSDELHCLAYIPTDFVHLLPITAIWDRATSLMTAAGFACTPRDISAQLSDTYHGHVVWIFEQAYIHYACHKFGLPDLATVAERCVPHIGEGQELLSVEPLIAPLGNTHQLWSVAARDYFASHQDGPLGKLKQL